MAIYHLSGQILGRAQKRNPDGTIRPGSKAVAAAAYRSGQKLTDRNSGETHDYSRRGGVVHSEIMAPDHTPPWLTDRETLWSNVEALEIRKDAQLAREFNMALPYELDAEQRLELVREFVGEQFVRRGMVADLALHDPIPEQGQSARNFHAHVMLTLRRATASGLDPVKTREWNSKELLNVWRAEWAVSCNRALERAGKKTRVDHRTLQAQRDSAVAVGDAARAAALKREPEVHVGPRARQAQRGGRPPHSKVREVGAPRRPDERHPAKRRKRDYPDNDKGTRFTWLESIVTNNDRQVKNDLRAINRRFDRLNHKLDYWQRRTAFYAEGVIKGGEFRYSRWKAADDEKQRKAVAARKVAHAQKRLDQLKAVMKALDGILVATTKRRETGLSRMRELESWMRDVRAGGRATGRGRER